jgi:hypothetical protein
METGLTFSTYGGESTDKKTGEGIFIYVDFSLRIFSETIFSDLTFDIFDTSFSKCTNFFSFSSESDLFQIVILANRLSTSATIMPNLPKVPLSTFWVRKVKITHSACSSSIRGF